MKKVLCLLLAVMLFVPLTACTSSLPTDTAADNTATTAQTETLEPKTGDESCGPYGVPYIAEIERDYANIRMQIPTGWQFRTVDYSTERGNDCFGIKFWPTGKTGSIEVVYTDAFGVCGTGLSEDEITLGRYTATRMVYDNEPNWTFLLIKDAPGDYVIENHGADEWMKDGEPDPNTVPRSLEAELDYILSSITVGEGIITESRAIEIADENRDIQYPDVSAYFNYRTGVWDVTYSHREGDIYVPKFHVELDHEGNVLNSGNIKS